VVNLDEPWSNVLDVLSDLLATERSATRTSTNVWQMSSAGEQVFLIAEPGPSDEPGFAGEHAYIELLLPLVEEAALTPALVRALLEKSSSFSLGRLCTRRHPLETSRRVLALAHTAYLETLQPSELDVALRKLEIGANAAREVTTRAGGDS